MLQLTTIIFLVAFTVLAGIHTLASHLYLYWKYGWLDIPVHFLGGIVVTLGLFTLRDLHLFPNKFLKFMPVLACVLSIALVWEVWEYLSNLTDTSILKDYIIDTVTDLCMGLTGGALGYFIGNNLRNLR